MRRKTTEEFKVDAIAVHGDQYDYSLVNYTGNKNKVSIICPKHGEFSQAPVNHVRMKQGCPKCSGKSRKTTAQFIAEAKAVHGNHYNYSLSEYVNNETKLVIICPEHGEFLQSPVSHVNRKTGCPKCGREKTAKARRIDKESAIERFRQVHGKYFDYARVVYKTRIPQ